MFALLSSELSLLDFLETRCEEQFTSQSALDSPESHYDPEQRYRYRKNLSLHQLTAQIETVVALKAIRRGLRTVPRTLKKVEGISLPIVVVETVKTPSGNVKPHQPILNGNLERLILAKAKKSHTRPNPHMIRAISQPTTYRISPDPLEYWFRVPVLTNVAAATFPSRIIAKPPCPSGPRGRKTETMTSRGGKWYTVRR